VSNSCASGQGWWWPRARIGHCAQRAPYNLKVSPSERRFVLRKQRKVNTVALSIPPESTHELYAQLLFVALQRLGIDAQSFLQHPDRARAASEAFAALWLAIELGAHCDDPTALEVARFDRTREIASNPQLKALAEGLDAGASQLSAVNRAGLLDVPPEQWQRCMPARGTDVKSTLALAWLAEAAVLGEDVVGWLADGKVLSRVVDALAILIEQSLEEGPQLQAEHLPLSRSVVTEDQRKALLDVWRAQRNPSLVSAVVSKPSANDTAASARWRSSASPSARAGADAGKGRSLLIAAALLCVGVLAWLMLAR